MRRVHNETTVTHSGAGTRRATQAVSPVIPQGSSVFREIFKAAPDGILAIGREGEILLWNTEAEKMFGYSGDEFADLTVEMLISEKSREEHARLLDHFYRFPRQRPFGTHLDLQARRKDGKEFPVDMTLSPLKTGGQTVAIVIIRDISEQRRVEEEREHLLAQIQEALAHVKTLHGLLPICAWCKKIRDDKGYWTRLEEYISTRTEAEFTHGICPDCAEKLHNSLGRRPL
jgi:PAS domain S-box-containing protein